MKASAPVKSILEDHNLNELGASVIIYARGCSIKTVLIELLTISVTLNLNADSLSS